MGEPPLVRYGGALQGLGLSTAGSGAEHKPLALLHNNDFEYSNILALWSLILHGKDHITVTLCKQAMVFNCKLYLLCQLDKCTQILYTKVHAINYISFCSLDTRLIRVHIVTR